MTLSPNGRVLRLGDLTPERIDTDFVKDGEPLQAWVVTNGRYPASVAAQLDDARNDYLATRERVWDGPPPPSLIDSARELLNDADVSASGVPDEQTIRRHFALIREALRAYDTVPMWRAREVDWSAYLTRCLLALIPGLEEQEADMMGTDVRLGVLIELGYVKLPQAQAQEEGGEPQGPPDQAGSTGAEHEPASLGSMAA